MPHSLTLYVSDPAISSAHWSAIVMDALAGHVERPPVRVSSVGALLQFWPIPSNEVQGVRDKLEIAKLSNEALLGFEMFEANDPPPLFR